MANNPYVNKVQFGTNTLIDLTSDTVTPDKVLSGATFHDKAGKQEVGTLTLATVATSGSYNDLSDKPTIPTITDTYSGTSSDGMSGKAVKSAIDALANDVYSNIGYLTEPIPSYVANHATALKRNITNAYYNGSLRSEIAAGNFKNVRPGDYIIGQASGTTYYVACLDWMFGKGDQTNATYQAQAYGRHHLGLMVYKHNGSTRLWAGYGDANKGWRVSANDKGRCPWNAAADVDPTDTEAIGANNTNITRTYNNASVSGYMGSFIRERIDNIILTEDYIADFGSENVLKFRNLNGNAVATDKVSGGQGNWNGCTSGWTWYDRYLDLPSEVELYGSRVFGSAMDIGVQCEQLPIFRNMAIHDIFPRLDVWTKAVAASSGAALRSSNGHATGHYGAAGALWACPLACIR